MAFAELQKYIALDMPGHGLWDASASGYDMERAVCDIESALTLSKVKGNSVSMKRES